MPAPRYSPLYEQPAYGPAEAAGYLKIPYQTLRYWLTGFCVQLPIVVPADNKPLRLSFMNLLECHILAGMRRIYDLKLPKVRRALEQIRMSDPVPHPLISQVFLTDHKDLFIKKLGQAINVSRYGQMAMNYYHVHLERVSVDSSGVLRFFPFVERPGPAEPRIIEINPMVGFGKPVLAGTSISTTIIASRFHARESVGDLAREYGCSPEQIEEAIRWEQPVPIAA